MSFRPASGTLTQGPVPLEGERRAISARARSIGCSLTPRDRLMRPKHNMSQIRGAFFFHRVSEELDSSATVFSSRSQLVWWFVKFVSALW